MCAKTIAFCGTRGIPAHYGGFETAVEEISKRLSEKGYRCEVFCRKYNTDELKKVSYQGCHLIYINGSKYRKLDTVISSLHTAIYLIKNRKRFDYILWFNNANFFGIMISKMTRVPIAVNTDGLEWRRAKWSWPFKLYYYLSSFIISRCCKTLISDSLTIQKYYKNHFKKNTEFIPYGAPNIIVKSVDVKELLNKFGVKENKYFLQITRFEPDNFPLECAKGFIKSGLEYKGFKYLIIGYKEGNKYADELIKLNGVKGLKIIRALYDVDILSTLRKNAFCYVHGNSVGGTNPALLEAMACCKRILAIDSPFSKEVLGNQGIFFNPLNIQEGFLEASISVPKDDKFKKRGRLNYSWAQVTDSYERIVNNQGSQYEFLINNK